MKRVWIAGLVVVLQLIAVADLSARGGRGGGFGGGFGGGRSFGGGGFGGGGGGFNRGGFGGGYGGGFDRGGFGGGDFNRGGGYNSFGGAGQFNRDGFNRGTIGGGEFNRDGFNREGITRGNGGDFNRGQLGGLNRDGFENGRWAGGRATAGELGNFLNMPQQGAGARKSLQGAESGSHTFTTPGGTQITVAGGGGSHTTAGGATIGGAGAGVKVEGAGGNTFVHGAGAGGISKNGNTAGHAGSFSAGKGAGGGEGFHSRGVTTAGGVTHAHSGGAVRGPGGNAIAGGRAATFVNGQFVGGHTWSAVNRDYHGWNHFTPGWYGLHPGCWWPGKWAGPWTAWSAATWALAGPYCGCAGDPMYYDYGGTITYNDDGNVYYGDQPIATTEQYYDQAQTLADSGAQGADDQWMPLGVFAIVSDGQKSSDKTIQLAVNKDGTIRGNYQDDLSDQVVPVIGAVDKETQRVAIHMQGNDKVVLETGLYNLTNDQAPALIHFGPDKQADRTLVRLSPPKDEQQQPAG